MYNLTTWKCYGCNLTFRKEQTAKIHDDLFKHPIQKIEETNV